MNESLLDQAWVKIAVFLVGFLVVLVSLFPVNSIERALLQRINQRLPSRLVLSEFAFESLNGVHADLLVFVQGSVLEFPFLASVPTIVFPDSVSFRSPVTDTGRPETPLRGQFNWEQRSLRLEADSYPLKTVVSNQEGVISGTLKVNAKETPNGRFTFRLTAPKLKNSPLYPPPVRGIRIRKFSGKGRLRGRTLKVRSLDFLSNKFIFEGTATLTLQRPIASTNLAVNLKMKQPVQKRIQRELTLKTLRITTT